MPSGDEPICLRVQLSSRPAAVYGFLATDAGRRVFWAASAPEREGVVHFRFRPNLDIGRRTTMITGVHTMFYTSDAAATRAFLRDTLGFPHTDVGDGWLIFDLPPATS